MPNEKSYRTDLVSEAAGALRSGRRSGQISGITTESTEEDGFSTEIVRILTNAGAEKIGKPIGCYVTVGLEPLTVRREPNAFAEAARRIAAEIRRMMEEQGIEPSAPVLVMGLGNEAITPDSIGPTAVKRIFATRKIAEGAGLRTVSCMSAGVLGTTGIEAAELLHGIIAETAPHAVIVIDALAASDSNRLCKSVQINDSGIVPGSGNRPRRWFDRHSARY